MLSLAFLELISATALVYSLLLIFVEVAPLEVMALLFVWTVIAGLFYFYSSSWSPGFRLSALLLIAPLYHYRSPTQIVFFLISVPLLLIYLHRFLLRGSYDNYVDNFHKVAIIYPTSLFLRWVAPEFGTAVNRSAPFIFVYFLSSILLIRSARHAQAGMDIRRLQGTNFRYLIVLATVFLLSTMERVQELASQTVRGLLSLLLLPIALLLKLLGWILWLLNDWTIERRGDWPTSPEMPGQESVGQMPPLTEGEPAALLEIIFEILQATTIVLLIAGAVYILYRLLLRGGRQLYQGLDYVEEREFLLRRPQLQRRFSIWQRIPKDPAEQIRFYYRKFLQKLRAQQVTINKAHTTLDIQKKAEAVFTGDSHTIRDIYIYSRYGEKAVNEAEVGKMKRLVKELDKKDRTTARKKGDSSSP